MVKHQAMTIFVQSLQDHSETMYSFTCEADFWELENHGMIIKAMDDIGVVMTLFGDVGIVILVVNSYVCCRHPLRPPHGVPVDILAFSNKILFTEEPKNISIVNKILW